MATIGTFKKSGTEFPGEIVTLSLQTRNVRIVPDTKASGENAPGHRVYVGRAEIGAAGSMHSNEGCDYFIRSPSSGRRRACGKARSCGSIYTARPSEARLRLG